MCSKNARFVVGDAEDLPFADESFDAVICANSFHHYPNPQAFFDGVARVLRPGGKLVLRDYTAAAPILWLMNRTEMPLANLIGHGDVRAYTLDEVRALCTVSGLVPVTLEAQKKFRLHLVARKPVDSDDEQLQFGDIQDHVGDTCERDGTTEPAHPRREGGQDNQFAGRGREQV